MPIRIKDIIFNESIKLSSEIEIDVSLCIKVKYLEKENNIGKVEYKYPVSGNEFKGQLLID